MILKNTFFKLINNAVFAKTMESVRKHTDKFFCVRTEYHSAKFFTETFCVIYMKKPGYLRLSILELNKVLMYEFWYGYVKPKYG